MTAHQQSGAPAQEPTWAGEDRLNFQTMTRSSVLDGRCEHDCAIELDCDHQGCDEPAMFVIQHQLAGGHPGGDDFVLVTVARCQPHSTVTRGLKP